MTFPVQVPALSVTWLGEVSPSPKLVSSLRLTVPEKPRTRLSAGSTASIVTRNGTPAVCVMGRFLWSKGIPKRKPLRTLTLTAEELPSGMVPSVWSWANTVKLPPAFMVTV